MELELLLLTKVAVEVVSPVVTLELRWLLQNPPKERKSNLGEKTSWAGIFGTV